MYGDIEKCQLAEDLHYAREVFEDLLSKTNDLQQKRILCNNLRNLITLHEPESKEQLVIKYGELKPMTEQEAHDFGREKISYGKYAGDYFSEIPDDYLAWLCDSKLKEWKKLRTYLAWRNNQQ